MCLVSQSCPTLCDLMDCTLPDSSVYGDSLGKNTGVGSHALLQGIFPTQRSNPSLLCLLHWQVYSLPLSHLGSPMIPNQALKISAHSTLVRWPPFFVSAFKKLSCNYSFLYAVMCWA